MGDINIQAAEYFSLAFSDHLAHVIDISMQPPQSRPNFKISPEVVNDNIFKERLNNEFSTWKLVRDRGLAIIPWWEIVVKPGVRRLAINRSKELNKQKRSVLNCLLMKQVFFKI